MEGGREERREGERGYIGRENEGRSVQSEGTKFMAPSPLLPSLQGFDRGEDMYQEPPTDGSGYSVVVEPERSAKSSSTVNLVIYAVILFMRIMRVVVRAHK